MFCEVQSWSKWEREKKRKKKKHLHPRSLSNSFSHMANIVLNLCYTQSEFSKICMGQMEAFLVFMPFWYSASWPSLVSRRVLLSYLQVSLFFLKVLVFHWSRHCCCGFDVSRGDGSESSPVSFHGSLKVDFEPVSVKLGLIATTGATHSTHTHTCMYKGEGKRRASWRSCCSMPRSRRFSWLMRHRDVTAKGHLFGVSIFFLSLSSCQEEVARYVGNA